MSDPNFPKVLFGAFVLESLTMGMYGESRNAIREYIQNSFDGLRTAVARGIVTTSDAKIEVTLDVVKEVLTIRDNGIGLHPKTAAQTLVSIGASRKDIRHDAGFRGIGRLAGIVFCQTLTFRTKHPTDSTITQVVFDAAKLKELLKPDAAQTQDAAGTLDECITISSTKSEVRGDHFFEVELKGFDNPPTECLDVSVLSSFLSQVSPLPYSPLFTGAEIIKQAEADNAIKIESVRLLIRKNSEAFVELFKPYRDLYTIKKSSSVPIQIEVHRSGTGKWWGWVGRAKSSGTIKQDARGIRIRVRNIQIDGSDVMRSIFADPKDGSESRMSYARFADWYVGEIFVDPLAAVPNARRDGFEEDDNWKLLRAELNAEVASKYGRLAYRISTEEQLSLAKLNSRYADLVGAKDRLARAAIVTVDQVAPLLTEANEVQRRINKASVEATDQEGKQLFDLAVRVGEFKAEVAAMQAQPHDCSTEVAEALSEQIQRLLQAFQDQLPVDAWQSARAIVEDLTGEQLR